MEDVTSQECKNLGPDNVREMTMGCSDEKFGCFAHDAPAGWKQDLKSCVKIKAMKRHEGF